MTLTPEERQKIYEEEKARLEEAKAQQDAQPPTLPDAPSPESPQEPKKELGDFELGLMLYFSKWHEAKELRIWIFAIVAWVALYPLAHFALDPWGWNPLSEGFLGSSSWQPLDRSSSKSLSSRLYADRPQMGMLYDNGPEFLAFFTVWLLPLIAFLLRHTYVRFVK